MIVGAIRSDRDLLRQGTSGSSSSASSVSIIDHEVDWHLTLQTTDVAMTEIVAQFMHLYEKDNSSKDNGVNAFRRHCPEQS